MDRLVYKDLLAWKASANRKPLVLYGARQVGKTWLLREFGAREFRRSVYINFDTNRKIHSFFSDDISPKVIIRGLENHFNEKIDPQHTLLIFDEIQECQRAKDSLKYFNEDAPGYHIAAAGSFLGIAGGKFPVGQVNELTLYPLSYSEFLEAAGHNLLAETLREQDIETARSPETAGQIAVSHALFAERLREYMHVGGMPEAVKTFVETGNFTEVRSVQEAILSSCTNDFSKHINAVNIPKVRMLWDSIPIHLAKEKKKFIYKEVKSGGRASEFENAMNWLVNTGLVYKIDRTAHPKIPLISCTEREYFKLYMHDVGLLAAKASLDAAAFSPGDSVFSGFKGAMAEQYVLQELKAMTKVPLCYWGNESGKAEVDFLMQHKNEIIPLEVKSAANTKSQSLSVYRDKYAPRYAVRISLKNYGRAGGILSIPLYMIGFIEYYIPSPVKGH